MLPEKIIWLDKQLNVVRSLRRVTPESELGRRLKEKDYDGLIVEHRDALADVLTSAGVLDPGSRLRVLGTQLDSIDVLLAEVDTHDQMGRLVIIEDKLLTNPEARREVLAQVLEYARHVQYEMSAEDLLGKVTAESRAWLEAQREELANGMRRGDFLLLICGDRIDPRLVDLAEPFMNRRADPLGLYELALVSLAFFADEDHAILVPNVVGMVRRGERDLTIRVVVQGPSGAAIDAEVTVDKAPVPRKPRAWTEETFFKRRGETFQC